MRLHEQMQRHHSPLMRFIRLFLFILGVFGILYGVYALPFFHLHHVVCVVQNRTSPCPSGVKEELERHTGENLFLFQKTPVMQKISHALKDVETIHIQRTFPDTLTIFLTMKDPVLYVQNEGVPVFYAVSSDGMVYTQVADHGKQLVILYAPDQPVSIGSVIPPDLVELFSQLSARLQAFPELVTSIRYRDENTIMLSFESGTKAILKSDGALQQLDTLQRILNDATMHTQKRIIDVRFQHPVIQ